MNTLTRTVLLVTLVFAGPVARADTAIGGALLPVPSMLHLQVPVSEKGSVAIGLGSGSSGTVWDLGYKHSFSKPNGSTYMRAGLFDIDVTFLGVNLNGTAGYAAIGYDWRIGKRFFLGAELGVAVNPNTGSSITYPNLRYMFEF